MVNRKYVKFLALRYKILAFIFVLLAAGLVLLPKYQKHEGISPKNLLSNGISPERYITSDDLADKIINQDPSILLIDVRNVELFNSFSLQNAINIPLEDILNEGLEGYLNQDAFDVILFSDDHFIADQAWLLCNRLGYTNLYVLEGGLNNWYRTIINPTKPSESNASVDHELFASRKAASMYFGVAYPEIPKKTRVQPKPKVAKKVVPVKKKKKMPIEGGC